MEYLVVVEKGKSSYGAYVPDLPGCVAVGETRREGMKLIREGGALHIESLREAGEPVPSPSSKSETIKVRAALPRVPAAREAVRPCARPARQLGCAVRAPSGATV